MRTQVLSPATAGLSRFSRSGNGTVAFRAPAKLALLAAMAGLLLGGQLAFAQAKRPRKTDPFDAPQPVMGDLFPSFGGRDFDQPRRAMVLRAGRRLDELPSAVMLELALSTGPVGRDMPGLEELVARMLEIDPNVVSARAKLTQAQAQLERIRMDVSRHVINTRAQWEVAKRTVEHLEPQVRKNPKDEKLVRGYVAARARLAQIENELPLLGTQVGLPTRPRGFVGASVGGPGRVPWIGRSTGATPNAQPRSPAVEKIRKALDEPTRMEFIETPLRDVVDFLKDKHQIEIVLDIGALEEVGAGPDIPLTVNLTGVRLADALQFIEDRYSDIRFVVRPYGILVTSPERAEYGYRTSRVDAFRGRSTQAAPKTPVRESGSRSDKKPAKPPPSSDPFGGPG